MALLTFRFSLSPLRFQFLNSTFDLKESLEDPGWKFWLGGNSRKDVWRLYHISILTAKPANEAFKILKDYTLLENRETRWSEKLENDLEK